MKRIWTKTAVAATFILLGFGSLQAAPQDSWYQSRESFYHSQDWKMHMFDRIRDDLTHVETVDFSGNDTYRIAQTQSALTDLQAKTADHRYDQPQLDDVIGTLTRVVADNRLSPRDRDILNDDLSRLRDYRAHHDDWDR